MSEQIKSNFDTWAESATADEVKEAIQRLDEEMARVSVAGMNRVASQQNILEDILKTKE